MNEMSRVEVVEVYRMRLGSEWIPNIPIVNSVGIFLMALEMKSTINETVNETNGYGFTPIPTWHVCIDS